MASLPYAISFYHTIEITARDPRTGEEIILTEYEPEIEVSYYSSPDEFDWNIDAFLFHGGPYHRPGRERACVAITAANNPKLFNELLSAMDAQRFREQLADEIATETAVHGAPYREDMETV